MKRLEGKVALITGAGQGIGAAAAQLFLDEGARVMLVDRNPAGVAAAAARMGEDAETFVADVADAELATRAVEATLARFGRLDVLVNNASMRNHDALAEASAQSWREVVDVNLVGAAGYCKAALPALRASGRGSIVNVSSCYAVAGRAGMGLYDATKAALLALTRTLAFEEAAHGVRANAVCPGSTLTEFHVERARAAGKSVAQLKTERHDTSLLARWAEPREIAYPILWLASDEASFVTGATLMVDGGLSIK